MMWAESERPLLERAAAGTDIYIYTQYMQRCFFFKGVCLHPDGITATIRYITTCVIILGPVLFIFII